MLRIIFYLKDASACAQYRCLWPTLHCYHELSQEGIQILPVESLLSPDESDVYVFHRVITPPVWHDVQVLRNRGKRIVWQIDDDVWSVPVWNPAHRGAQDSRHISDQMREISDQIWVSTPHLASVVGRPEKTTVLPNLIDLVVCPELHHSTDGGEFTYRCERPVRILWAGSTSHDRDLDEILEPLTVLLHKYHRRIQVYFWGYFPESFTKYHRPAGGEVGYPVSKCEPFVVFLNPVPMRQYFDKLACLRPDIALAPLCDCPFNKSKSGIKFLETTMAGAAFVGTDIEPYNWIQPGEGMLIPPGNANRWVSVLSELVEDREKRAALSRSAKRTVVGKHSWQYSRHAWLSAFRRLKEDYQA